MYVQAFLLTPLHTAIGVYVIGFKNDTVSPSLYSCPLEMCDWESYHSESGLSLGTPLVYGMSASVTERVYKCDHPVKNPAGEWEAPCRDKQRSATAGALQVNWASSCQAGLESTTLDHPDPRPLTYWTQSHESSTGLTKTKLAWTEITN